MPLSRNLKSTKRYRLPWPIGLRENLDELHLGWTNPYEYGGKPPRKRWGCVTIGWRPQIDVGVLLVSLQPNLTKGCPSPQEKPKASQTGRPVDFRCLTREPIAPTRGAELLLGTLGAVLGLLRPLLLRDGARAPRRASPPHETVKQRMWMFATCCQVKGALFIL